MSDDFRSKKPVYLILYIFILVSVVGLIIFTIHQNQKRHTDYFDTNSLLLSRLLTEISTDYFGKEIDIQTLNKRLEEFSSYPNVWQCSVYDSEGAILAEGRKKGVAKLRVDQIKDFSSYYAEDKHFIKDQILIAGDIGGYTILVIDYAAHKIQFTTINIIIIITGIILLLAIIMIRRYYSRQASISLKQLIKEFTGQYGGQGDGEAEKSSINQLRNTFDLMVHNLEKGKREKKAIEVHLRESLEELKASREKIFSLMQDLDNQVKKKHEALQILEGIQLRLDLAVNGSSDGFWDWPDVNRDENWWSGRIYELLHYQSGELVPSRSQYLNLIHPEDRKKEAQVMQSVAAGQNDYNVTLRMRLKEGAYHWFNIRGRVLFSDNHQPMRMSGAIQDINERVMLQREMDAQIRELRTISTLVFQLNLLNSDEEICNFMGKTVLEYNPQAKIIITLYDPVEGVITLRNIMGVKKDLSELNRIMGFDFGDLRIKPNQEFADAVIPEASKVKLYKMENGIYDLMGHLLSKTVSHLVLKFLQVDDVYHIGFGLGGSASGGLTIMLPAGCDPKHKELIETLMNFSSASIGRIQASKILEENQQYLNLAIESGNMGIWEWDVDSDEVKCNDGWFAMLGYQRTEIRDLNGFWESILHPEDKEGVLKKLDDFVSGKSASYQEEYRLKCKNGDWKWVRAQGRIMDESSQGDSVRVIGSHIDIDDLKRSEIRIAKLNDNLEELVKQRTGQLLRSYKDIEDFSYTVSHDLKAPLRAISGYTEIIRSDNPQLITAETTEMLDSIQQNIKFMDSLIDGLLYYLKIGKMPLNSEEIDPAEIAWEAYNHMKERELQAGIDLKIAELSPAKGNAAMLKILFSHLLANAIKFRQAGEHLEIEIGQAVHSGQLYYYVKDNGIGFEMAHANHIFKIFHTLNPTDKNEGTGLGLAICQRIIQKHGGEIYARSVPGKGTTFFFSLEGDKHKNTD